MGGKRTEQLGSSGSKNKADDGATKMLWSLDCRKENSYLANQFAIQNASIAVGDDAKLYNVNQSIIEKWI